jgi:PAS domain S-box-containing protein
MVQSNSLKREAEKYLRELEKDEDSKDSVSLLRDLIGRYDDRQKELECKVAEFGFEKSAPVADVLKKNGDQQYGVLLNSNSAGVAVNGVFVCLDGAGVAMFGVLTQSEITGRKVLDFVHPDYRKLLVDKMDLLNEVNVVPLFELGLIRVDGTFFNTEVTLESTLYRGKPACRIIVNNRSTIKKVERDLNESEARYYSLLEFAPDAFFQGDEKWDIITTNSKASEYTGYSKEELLSINLSQIFKNNQFAEKPFKCDKVLSVKSECAITKKNGQSLNVEVNSRRLPNGTYQLFVRDISERIKAEDALREKEKKFRLLYENAPLSYQSLDLKGCLIDVNSTWLKTLGYTRNEVLGRYFGDFMTPESAELIKLRFPELLKAGEIRNFIFEMIRKDGSHLSVSYEGRVGNDEFGNFKQTHCIFADITESKKTEKRLVEERILLRTIIDNLPDAIYAKDLKGQKLFSNKADIQYLGCVSESQVINNKDFDIFPKDIAVEFDEIEQLVIDTGKPSINYRKDLVLNDNKVHCFITSKFPLRNEQDKIIGLVGIISEITEKVLAEQKIIQLSKGVEQSPASIMLTNLDGDIEYVNQKFRKVSGYTNEEVMGRNPRFLSSGETSKSEYFELWNAITSGDEWKGEFHNKKKNGDLYWESALISPIRDENGKVKNFLAIKEDITRKKAVEQEILKLTAGMEQSPTSIVITDTEGVIEYVNKKFMETSGYSSEFLLGKMLRILKREHSPEEVFKTIWGNLKKGDEWRGEHLNRRKNEEVYWESVLISPVKDMYGSVINYIVISEDISDRKKMESDLLAAKERAEESDRLKSAFINNMSHEIRTPLNAIVGFSDLLATREVDVDQSSYFCEIIHNSSDQLVQIIADIINISTIDAGQIDANLKAVNVNNIMITLFEQFHLINKNENVKITYVSTLNDEEAMVLSDETKLTQVITNLIFNSLKFTERGKLEFGVKKEQGQLYFWVEDTGIGISPEMHEKIFDRFRQGDSSIVKKYGGTGLGLSIAKSFVELLGGEIGLTSVLGEGSRFYFTLPYVHAVKK